MVIPYTLNRFKEHNEDGDDFVEEIKEKSNGNIFVSFFSNSMTSDIEGDGTAETENSAADMEKEAVNIENEARRIFEDAYVQGEKAGYEMGMKKVEPLIKRLNGDIAALSTLKEELFKKAEKMSVELALIFAEAIILKKCDENRDIVINMAKKALEICEEKSGITIRIRRDDARYISEDQIYPLKVLPDDTLKDPGFIIETGFGDIDGTIATQLEELRKEFCNGHAER